MTRLARARERALSGCEAPEVRAHILDSWARVARSGVDPERHLPPVPLARQDVLELRAGHPLAPVWRLLRTTLRGALGAPGHVLFLADAAGHLLWVDGDPAAVRRAEDAHLVPGARWSEESAGTNGVGTSLALARPFRVFGPEHYLSMATGFVCSAAPIRDPLAAPWARST
jgi:transcriptional regulator of acetoin/glycerol metabolism